jgi:hypothetical protein
MAAFDSHILSEWMVREQAENGSLSLGQAQLFKFMGEGFILAMRWLLGRRESVDVRPSPRKGLLEIGNELIDYGSRYFRASILYSGYSQGKMEAVVFPEACRVRFAHKAGSVAEHATWGFAEEASHEMSRNTPERRQLSQSLQARAAEVFRQTPHRFEGGRIVLGDAQEQLGRIIRILSGLPQAVRESHFPFVEWGKVTHWYGVVITPEGEPGLEYDHSTFPACSFVGLRQRLSAKEWRSPSRLWSAMVVREWQAEIRAGRVEYEPFELAGITFENPILLY